jgi:hypothetical protein
MKGERNMMKKILILILVGFLVLSGFGVAATINNKATTITNSLVTTDNHPPYAPSNYTPCGGVSENVVNLSWDGGDPDLGDTVTYDVFFGRDPLNLPLVAIVGPYPWNQTRIEYGPVELECYTKYYWKIGALDDYGHYIAGYVCVLSCSCENQPPGAPTITGPSTGKVGEELSFVFNAVDPDGDQVQYIISWGDSNSDTTDLSPSGTDVTVKHTWMAKGAYTIIAKAQDEHGSYGPEASPPIVSITKNKGKAINILIQNFIRQHSTAGSQQSFSIPSSITSGVTLSSQKQLESRESKNLEKLQFWYLIVHVKEIYGTVDDPQYRPLANVTVEIKDSIFGIIWEFFWNGTTNENGEIVIDIINALLYKVTISKDGYHTYKCRPSQIVMTGDQFEYHVYFTMAENGSPFTKQSSQSSQQQKLLKQPQLEEVDSELQSMDLDSLLTPYGIDTEDTMGEFEQSLYNLVSKERRENPSLAAELMNDVDELSDLLEQIGVTDDMAIAKAIPIIEDNKEKLQAEGKNLFCSIDIYLSIGSCWPTWRLFNAMYGIWDVDEIWDDTSHVTIKGLTGLQSCEGKKCAEDYEGRFICLIGIKPPVMLYNFQVATPYMWVRGFVYFSESNVPFVNSTSNSQQSQCPCNQQGSNQQSSTGSITQISQLLQQMVKTTNR